jgi:hypothetical protein
MAILSLGFVLFEINKKMELKEIFKVLIKRNK